MKILKIYFLNNITKLKGKYFSESVEYYFKRRNLDSGPFTRFNSARSRKKVLLS